jgi:hypothetical protein
MQTLSRIRRLFSFEPPFIDGSIRQSQMSDCKSTCQPRNGAGSYDCTANAAMPPAGQSWKYKDIYLQADQRVGQWSDVVSIPVAG